jgi:hypothetical protein
MMMMMMLLGDHPLTAWEKIAIIFTGGALICVSLLLVVCIVVPTCCVHKILHKGIYRPIN